jgi:multidrug transporter EmrE-like cation transporter
MSVTNIATFAIAVLTQLAAIALLPRTNGFTQLAPTLLCSALFVIGIGALARLAHAGVELGILIPMMSAVIPLVTIVIGVVVYGESTSPVKLALLGLSCVLVGIAASRA